MICEVENNFFFKCNDLTFKKKIYAITNNSDELNKIFYIKHCINY